MIYILIGGKITSPHDGNVSYVSPLKLEELYDLNKGKNIKMYKDVIDANKHGMLDMRKGLILYPTNNYKEKFLTQIEIQIDMLQDSCNSLSSELNLWKKSYKDLDEENDKIIKQKNNIIDMVISYEKNFWKRFKFLFTGRLQ